MPVATELKPFFTNLVEKSRRHEINWEANGREDSYIVRFDDFSIAVAQDAQRPQVQIRLLNDQGGPTTIITVDKGDADWLAAVSVVNSAHRKVRKIDHTLQRALEELGREGEIGLGTEVG